MKGPDGTRALVSTVAADTNVLVYPTSVTNAMLQVSSGEAEE